MARSIFFYTDSRVLGGAENAMFMLLESLDREAWDPTLLLDDVPGVEALAQRASALGVRLERVPPLPLGLAGARRVPGMARFLARRRPQVFHAHMSSPVACKYALAAAVTARVPAVLGTVQVGEYEPPDRLAYWQLRALARGVGAYLAVSRAIAAELVDRLAWSREKVSVSYNAVEPSRFTAEPSAALRRELGADGGVPLVLVPARLDAQKGHATLLRAAVEVPRAIFALAGEGPERTSLEALAVELGVADRVRFLGRRDDVPELLATCDIFALPSLYEGSSLAVLEAMAARRPIVSSAIPGTDELVADGCTGLLVPPGDPGALAAALRRLIADPELAARLAGAARRRVDADLSRTAMATRVEAVYRRLLADGEEAGGPRSEEEENRVLRAEDWRFACAEARLLTSWRTPRPGAAKRARRRAEAAGFTDVSVYWAGPLPHRPPNYWLPLDSPEAVRHLLSSSRIRSFAGLSLRFLWRIARAAGLLAPIYVVGRPADAAGGSGLPRSTQPLLLLTGGHRSINKVVGLAFAPGADRPDQAIKFARTREAEPGLEREAGALARLAAEEPPLRVAPQLRGRGERAGRLAVVEEAVAGESLLGRLDEARFAGQVDRMLDLLLGLARGRRRDSAWRERLVESPLRDLERNFGGALAEPELALVRELLGRITDPPPAFEHRDCSPWNVLIGSGGSPILLDWESAEPDGLAGLDLVYFLANCVFVLDDALDRGTTRESYARMLDGGLPAGRVSAAAMDRYAEALGMDRDETARLRLLCWVIHSRSDHRHLTLAAAGPPSVTALRGAPFLGLIQEELARAREI